MPRLIIGIDVRDDRLALGKDFGADHVFNPTTCDLEAELRALTGGLGVDRLSVTVASLTSLSVYLIPLLALLMSFDAIAIAVRRHDGQLRR